MIETLSEFEGCTHLSRLFRRRGYVIERNVMFREYGVEFHIDGWDKKARVGFEFLTSEDDDLVQSGLGQIGDQNRWSEDDMFRVNEELIGRKIEYDGNPQQFATKGFNGIPPNYATEEPHILMKK